jgi:hypothetical protein
MRGRVVGVPVPTGEMFEKRVLRIHTELGSEGWKLLPNMCCEHACRIGGE